MTDDREKEEAEESITALDTFAGGLTPAIEEPNAAITEVTGIPVGVLDERLDNFAKYAGTLIAQEEKIEIDLEGAPKESKFAHAKRTKTRFEANYEPLDVKKLVNKVTPAEIVTREEAKPETKGNTARMPMVAVPVETSTMGIGPSADSMMPGSSRPTPTPPPPSVGKTTVPETPAALAKVHAKTILGVSEDAVREKGWAKKEQEYEADLKKKEEVAAAVEKRGVDSVSPGKKSLPEGVLGSWRGRTLPMLPMSPKIPVQQVVREEKVVPRRRVWGIYAGAAAMVVVTGLAVVAWKSKGKKDVVPSVVSASVRPVAISPPLSATSPPMVQVAESDAGRVAEHDAPAPMVTGSGVTSEMKSSPSRQGPRRKVGAEKGVGVEPSAVMDVGAEKGVGVAPAVTTERPKAGAGTKYGTIVGKENE